MIAANKIKIIANIIEIILVATLAYLLFAVENKSVILHIIEAYVALCISILALYKIKQITDVYKYEILNKIIISILFIAGTALLIINIETKPYITMINIVKLVSYLNLIFIEFYLSYHNREQK